MNYLIEEFSRPNGTYFACCQVVYLVQVGFADRGGYSTKHFLLGGKEPSLKGLCPKTVRHFVAIKEFPDNECGHEYVFFEQEVPSHGMGFCLPSGEYAC
jgi:hypothetical protein